MILVPNSVRHMLACKEQFEFDMSTTRKYRESTATQAKKDTAVWQKK
jgi:hypothetical protein